MAPTPIPGEPYTSATPDDQTTSVTTRNTAEAASLVPPPLSDAAPAGLATVAAAGVGASTARDDHKHPLTGVTRSTLLTAKGDIFVASGNNSPGRLGVGADKQLLVADAAAAQGVKWGGPADIGAIAAGIAAQQKVGPGPDPNPVTNTQVNLLVSASRVNPDKLIEQHFVGYSFYSGSPTNAGTFQGGSCEAYCFANGTTDWTQPVLGFEGIGKADGDNSVRTFGNVIGLQGTAAANGVITVAQLTSIRARGPHRDSGTATVNRALSLEIFEPTVGTTRLSLFGIGTHRFRKGAGANTIEIADATDVMRWNFTDAKLTGHASNGTNVRLILDTNDTPADGRIKSHLFGAGKHVSLSNSGAEVFNVSFDGKIAFAAVTTATAPAAGAAGALPAAPVGYMTVTVNGTNRQVAYY